jgi:hypothetical protein
MSKEEKFEKDLEKAINWVAAEHKYFQKLQKDLSVLKQGILEACSLDTASGIKKIMFDIRYIGRSERRLNRYVKDAKDLSKAIRESIALPEQKEKFDEILKEIDIEAAHLVRDASRYDGKLHELLSHLEDSVHEHNLEQAQQVIMQCLEVVEEAERWIAALSLDLTKAKKVAQKFAEIYHKDIDGIKAAISILTDQAKIDYLVHFLKAGKSIKRKTRLEVIDLLVGLVSNKNYSTEMNIGLIQELGLYEIAGDLYFKNKFFEKAGLSYEKAESYIKEAKVYELLLETDGSGEFIFSYIKKFNYLQKLAIALLKAKRVIEAFKQFKIFLNSLIDHLKIHSSLDLNLYNSSNKIINSFEVILKLNLPTSMKNEYLLLVAKFKTIFSCYKIFDGSNKSKTNYNHLQKVSYNYLRKAGYSKIKAYRLMADWLVDRYHKADYYEKAGEWALAEEQYVKLGNKTRAEIMRKKAEKQKIKVIKRLGSTSKIESLIKEGDKLFKLERFVEAIDVYSNAGAWDKVADCHNKMGNGLKAMKFYRKSVDDFRKKFGFDKIEGLPLKNSVKIDVILENLKDAGHGEELLRALDELVKLIENDEDALSVTHYLKDVKVVKPKHWRFLAGALEKKGLEVSAAEYYALAGEAEDNIKSARLFRSIGEPKIAALLSLYH